MHPWHLGAGPYRNIHIRGEVQAFLSPVNFIDIGCRYLDKYNTYDATIQEALYNPVRTSQQILMFKIVSQNWDRLLKYRVFFPASLGAFGSRGTRKQLSVWVHQVSSESEVSVGRSSIPKTTGNV